MEVPRMPTFVLPLIAAILTIGTIVFAKRRRLKDASPRTVAATAAGETREASTSSKWKTIKKGLALDESGKIWDEHKKAVLGTIFGVLFFNLFLAYVEPFTAWHKSFRATGSNFWWINSGICVAVIMLTVFGDAGKKLSRLAWGLTAVALLAFSWNYFKVGAKVKSVANSVTGFFATKNANAQGTEGSTSTVPARDRYFGPERDRVLAYFADDSVMADISGSESEFHHWSPTIDRDTFVVDSSDTCKGVLTNRNKDGSTDFGVMQINSIHANRAMEMGHDICTLEGNLAFARVLYESEGTTPWNSSKARWATTSKERRQTRPTIASETVVIEATSTVTDSVDRMEHTQIRWWVPSGKEGDVFVIIDDGSRHAVTDDVPPSQYYRFVTGGDTIQIRVVLQN